ncbi:hypothetical protein D3W54_11560 [Komagataeibacter medellinensis]|uniref:Glycosyltransferase RgtA/B/C/D-like domain-containing protein n=1 Tax=Komagataeibacter medellinensis TaxID=1177712 RepID=A0ABQ6VZV7_9PROT|nr:hypothetical protein [Komagataeibacter medellinensis]KAB8124708.1 hypothetical protein D3W54_11560 [Komagataeibacter medellinensis]
MKSKNIKLDTGYSIWISFGIFFALILLAPHLAFISSHVSLSSNEGWNAYLSQRAMGMDPAPLYPPSGQMVFNNYPPSSFYVVGLLGWLLGDMIVAGRIIALVALLFCAYAAGRVVCVMGGTRAGSWFAGLLVIIYSAVFYSDYVGMDDPQWLGQGIVMLGLLLLVDRASASGRSTAWRTFGAGCVMVAGLSVKHNILALPAAVMVWLVLTDWRRAMVWLSGCLLALCVLGGLFYACFGPDFVHGVFGHKRIFYGYRILKGMSNVVGLSGMMVAGLFLRRMRLAHGYGLLLGLYLLLAVAFAIVQRMGTGVTHNACFEALIAAAMCAGLAVSYLLKGGTLGRLPPRVTLVGMAGLNLLPVVVCMPTYLPYLYRITAADIVAHEGAWKDTIAAVHNIDGDVACETLAMCYWAGKPAVIDFFNYSQHVAVTHEATALEQAVDRQAIAAFVSSSRFGRLGEVWAFSNLWHIIRSRYTHVREQGAAYIVTP